MSTPGSKRKISFTRTKIRLDSGAFSVMNKRRSPSGVLRKVNPALSIPVSSDLLQHSAISSILLSSLLTSREKDNISRPFVLYGSLVLKSIQDCMGKFVGIMPYIAVMDPNQILFYHLYTQAPYS